MFEEKEILKPELSKLDHISSQNKDEVVPDTIEFTIETDPKSAADEAKPLALKWINNAILILNACIHSIQRPGVPHISVQIGLPILRRHFHTDRLRPGTTEIDAFRRIEQNYQSMRRCISVSDAIFQSADDEAAALNTRGVFGSGPIVAAYVYTMRSISFTTHFPRLGPNCKAAVIIHELAHYIDQRFGHTGGEFGPAYDHLDFETALYNVYCYPNFAVNATPPYRNEFYGLSRPDV
jgi:hypothetical protein